PLLYHAETRRAVPKAKEGAVAEIVLGVFLTAVGAIGLYITISILVRYRNRDRKTSAVSAHKPPSIEEPQQRSNRRKMKSESSGTSTGASTTTTSQGSAKTDRSTATIPEAPPKPKSPKKKPTPPPQPQPVVPRPQQQVPYKGLDLLIFDLFS
ncbi:hypothetical protein PMAYCL1PPCAC_03065, partial [Pristionchus mayeri]